MGGRNRGFLWGPVAKSKAASDSELRLPLAPADPMLRRRWSWWITVSFYTALLLAAQTAATLLNRYYYDQGGNSKWMETLTFSAGFPVLYLPLLLSPPSPAPRPPVIRISTIYIGLGLITAATSLMYSYGLLYLSVSTYALVCSSQLAFNAVFSYLLNKDKFTHLTLNSVVLLTFSSAIIGAHPDSDSGFANANFPLGFVLTLAASASYSLILSLMELTFDRVVKSRSFSAVLDMQVYTAMVSTVAAVAGLFASGEWRGIREEAEGFGKGRVGYVMTVAWAAVAWQLTNVGLVGLIFEVSALFSNVISTLGMPVVPVFAVALFGDRMGGVKVISLLLAVWGSVSYFYQHYLDYRAEKMEEVVVVVEEEVRGRGVNDQNL